MTDLTLESLQRALALLREAAPARGPFVCNIDDAHGIFRAIRKMGYKVLRIRHAIWRVQIAEWAAFEIYVDPTRTITRGYLFEIPSIRPFSPALTYRDDKEAL